MEDRIRGLLRPAPAGPDRPVGGLLRPGAALSVLAAACWVAAAAIALGLTVRSLGWPLVLDGALMHYIAARIARTGRPTAEARTTASREERVEDSRGRLQRPEKRGDSDKHHRDLQGVVTTRCGHGIEALSLTRSAIRRPAAGAGTVPRRGPARKASRTP